MRGKAEMSIVEVNALGGIATAFLIIAGSIIGVWYRLVLRIERVRDEGHAANMAIKDELHAFKLEASGRYASIGYLKDVEERLIKAIDNLTVQHERARTDLNKRLDRLLEKLDHHDRK